MTRMFAIVCAYDQREAREVVRSIGEYGRDAIVLASPRDVPRLHGLAGKARVVETRRFFDRPDAWQIRGALIERMPGLEFEDWPGAGPVLAEQHGGNGVRGLDAIAAAAAPAGTRPGYWVVRIVTRGLIEDGPMLERLKRDLAVAVGQPHLLLTLTADDYGPGDWIPAGYFEHVWAAVIAVTLNADRPPYAVIRPGAALPEGRLSDALDGKWIVHPGHAPIRMSGGELSFSAEYLHARATGRIEARETRLIEGGPGGFEIAEVFEVNP